MSKISLSPDASGTGIFTIASPNSNTNRTLTLPDDTGTIVTNSGNQAGSFTTLNTSGAVVFNDAGADVDFRVEGDTDANLLFVDAGNNRIGIGTSTPGQRFDVASSGDTYTRVRSTASAFTGVDFGQASSGSGIIDVRDNHPLIFYTNDTERMRLTSGGDMLVGTSTALLSGGKFQVRTASTSQVSIAADSPGGFTSDTESLQCDRAANSAYGFLRCVSGGYSDTEFLLRGDGNAYADGSWNGSGADYAEYFESATGEAIPRGTTVVLENNKVRAATADDPTSSIIGVVRPKEFGKGSMVVGNLAWNMWTDKYITDDFGVYEMEDHDVVEWEETITDEEGNTSTKQHSYESWKLPEGVTVPADATRKTHDENGKKFQHRKLNPNYDPAAEYTPREERPEWLIIGLLGQVPVLKGQPVGDRWIKMRDVSETVEEWMIR